MKMGLEDKVVIVTGAASGIGGTIAWQSAQEGVRALVPSDRNDHGGPTLAANLSLTPAPCVAHDLADPDAAQAIAAGAGAVAGAAAGFGRIDARVKAAGMTTRGSVESGSFHDWETLFAVNAQTPIFRMQAAIADMKARGAAGSTVNILSMNADCGIPERAIAAGTKGAPATLTRNAADARMANMLWVNGSNLGWVVTPSDDHKQPTALGPGPGWLQETARHQPLGWLVRADEVANLAVFLLDEASIPTSGSVVDFDQKVAWAI